MRQDLMRKLLVQSPVSLNSSSLAFKLHKRTILAGLAIAAILLFVARLGKYNPNVQSQNEAHWQKVFVIEATPVKDLLLSEVPELRNPNLPDAQRVELIRHWVAQQIDIGSRTANCLSNPTCNQLFRKADISQVIAAFRNDQTAVLCGGAAVTLKLVYDAFGYKSSTLGIGTLGQFTHMVTLVDIQQGNGRSLVIQDPTVDTSYRAADGHLLDYFELLSLLKQDKANQIIPTNAQGVVRDTTRWFFGFGPFTISKRMNIQKTILDDPRVPATLQAAGCPVDAAYFYALPYAFYRVSPEQAKALTAQAHSILGDAPCAPSAQASSSL
jgi:hypothetical protein